MCCDVQDEELHWVPRKATEIGINFIHNNLPHAPQSLIMEFLRKMNKAWMKRETRKFNRIKEIYERKMKDLKRQIANSK